MQEGASSEGDEARCLNGSFIAKCKKEESQWEERIKIKSNPGMGRCQKEEAQKKSKDLPPEIDQGL